MEVAFVIGLWVLMVENAVAIVGNSKRQIIEAYIRFLLDCIDSELID
jgi:hypothetical protein